MKSYDDSKPNKYIMYLDVNNLYSWAMSHYHSYSEFKWLNQTDIDEFDVNLIVDLEYPDELRELHNDYLLAPEKLEISHDILSK